MQKQSNRIISGLVGPAVLLLAIFAGVPHVQAQQVAPVRGKVSIVTAAPAASNDADASVTQDQLIKLLRLSPTLTTVVARDPSLLADKDYVARNNPELAKYLAAHPEVVRNPDFYLFSHLPGSRGHQDLALMRSVWPDLVSAPQQIFVPGSPQSPQPQQDSAMRDMIGPFFACLGFLTLLGSLLWLIHMFLQNRRWNRIFRLQTEVHGKLIDRFGNNQELLTYMGTEAGKRFLEAAPIPMDFKYDQQRMPNAVARVLTPLQIGVVLALLGIGLLLLRHGISDLATPLLLFGVVVLMPGLGFILSAGITWVLAGRLGLMPEGLAGSHAENPEASERQ
jgi:hypothetical protein